MTRHLARINIFSVILENSIHQEKNSFYSWKVTKKRNNQNGFICTRVNCSVPTVWCVWKFDACSCIVNFAPFFYFLAFPFVVLYILHMLILVPSEMIVTLDAYSVLVVTDDGSSSSETSAMFGVKICSLIILFLIRTRFPTNESMLHLVVFAKIQKTIVLM